MVDSECAEEKKTKLRGTYSLVNRIQECTDTRFSTFHITQPHISRYNISLPGMHYNYTPPFPLLSHQQNKENSTAQTNAKETYSKTSKNHALCVSTHHHHYHHHLHHHHHHHHLHHHHHHPRCPHRPHHLLRHPPPHRPRWWAQACSASCSS
jgi:hypothetical protein